MFDITYTINIHIFLHFQAKQVQIIYVFWRNQSGVEVTSWLYHNKLQRNEQIQLLI